MSITESQPSDSGTHPTRGELSPARRARLGWLRYAFAWPVPVQPLLWGVDDAETRRYIEQAVYRKHNGIRWLVLFVVGATVTEIVAKRLVARVAPAFPEWVVFGGVLFLWQSGIASWLRRGILRELRRTLASMGRCEGCGYDLKDSNAGACPECGVVIERQLTIKTSTVKIPGGQS